MTAWSLVDTINIVSISFLCLFPLFIFTHKKGKPASNRTLGFFLLATALALLNFVVSRPSLLSPAFESGFNSKSGFNKAFKKNAGWVQLDIRWRRNISSPTMRWGILRTINLLIAIAVLFAVRLTGQQVMLAPSQTDFSDMRLGLFVHYTYVGRPYQWGCTTWSDGSPVASLDELAENLDVQNLVRTAARMRAQHLQFTAWQANMNVLFPSAGMARKPLGRNR